MPERTPRPARGPRPALTGPDARAASRSHRAADGIDSALRTGAGAIERDGSTPALYQREVRATVDSTLRSVARALVGLALLAVGVALWRSQGGGDLQAHVTCKAFGFPLTGIGATLLIVESLHLLVRDDHEDGELPVAILRRKPPASRP
jgi:hypothetical protein